MPAWFPHVEAKWVGITMGLLFVACVFFSLAMVLHLRWPNINFWWAFLMSVGLVLVEYVFKTAATRIGYSHGMSVLQMQLTWTAFSLLLAIPLSFVVRKDERIRPIESFADVFR